MTSLEIPCVPAEVRDLLVAWSEEAAPDEACGVIVNGKPFRLTNVHSEPEAYFHMDDDELLAIYATHGAPEACWHSHPNGDPAPSSADVEGTPPGMRMLIVARGEVWGYDVS